jgi:exodeoxyribonuclease-1
MAETFLWHDYETFGADPRADRPAQFAALRTGADLEPVEAPFLWWCRLAADYLPHPEACRVTGIGPRQVGELGLPERDFIGRIQGLMAVPGTCTTGYNSLRFDDEVTRHTLYRNLMDPYAREWQNGNSRFDLLDVMRCARTFRPLGLAWPDHGDGTPSFRLEDLTAANGIPHEGAHDALADVKATLELARRLRSAQGRLWDYALKTRNKQWVLHELDLRHPAPLIHVSGRYKALQGCFSLVLPLGAHPSRPNEVFLWDLRQDPALFLDLDEAALARDLRASPEALGGRPRLPVKSLHANRCPMIMKDLRFLTPEVCGSYGLDLDAARRRADLLLAREPFMGRVRQAAAQSYPPGPADPDFTLYEGGFLGNGDRTVMARIQAMAPAELGGLRPVFQDPRLGELFFRYRARNWPELLDPEAAARWKAHCEARRRDPGHPSLLGREAFLEALAGCRASDPGRRDLWDDLEALVDEPCPAGDNRED